MSYVIIGGDAAGMSAAMQIVRTKDKPTVTVLEKGAYYSYGQCGLPYFLGGHLKEAEQLIARPRSVFQEKYGIDARVFHEVQQVDPVEQIVYGIDHDKQQPFEMPYETLLVASGGRPKILNLPGLDLDGVFPLKTIPDANNINHKLETAQNIVVVGGGYIGLEVAENFRERGKNVTIIQHSKQLASMIDADLAELVHEEAKAKGINVHLEEAVVRLDGDTKVSYVTTDQGKYQADLVIMATGLQPNTDFLPKEHFHLAPNGAVLVNAYMETSYPNVYAAGDCATQYNVVKKRQDYIPLGTTANKQGQVAGRNMAGSVCTFKGITGTSIIRFFDLEIAKTGLSASECEQLGIPYKVAEQEATDIAGYFANREKMTVRLVYHAKNRTLLGGQIIGKHGVDKRIDVLSVALFHEMTIDALEDLDLSYAPPFNSVWDPLQQVARKQ
ncbi:FAD-dependent oxidoreductase [Bacillaceae bacterium SIJ1]|uniref:FAD-dependent oxidoreductase n=1 Tax=Litoribacterium kuwaitense TaxID=1398745 RepID=UPI0013EB5013|nr:FAD-dependent oxidoreductase [Litoribacterium kuwaitense]NGP44718.1 FAD-dependent oxidoreductase [Litoribacterium kuwaitense]